MTRHLSNLPSRRFLLRRIAPFVLGLVMTPLTSSPAQAQANAAKPTGWLRVERLRGEVTYRGTKLRAARLGDRLEHSGTSLSTAARSGVKLDLDNQIGSIHVAENTRLQVRHLTTQADGGRVTVLDVPRGQVRLQVRRFFNPSSRLEVHTPSGVAAVRGTEFGVSTGPEGKTAVGTVSGAVETSAQNKSVMLNPGFASVVLPGQAPSTPMPLDRVLSFRVLDYRQMDEQVNLIAQVNPANTVVIDGESVPISIEGRIELSLRPNYRHYLPVEVSNPLGETRKQWIWMY